MFSKNRRDKKGRDSAANSIKSSESDGLRPSLEDAIDKLKANTEDGESNGIKKLVPRALGSKRRRKQHEREEEQRASEEAARGRTVAERGTLENDVESTFRNQSEAADTSSLITYDSES
jgi:hypothetical protein